MPKMENSTWLLVRKWGSLLALGLTARFTILSICPGIMPSPDNNQYLPIRYGQASNVYLPHQLPHSQGHHGEYPLLSSETSRNNALYGVPQISRVAAGQNPIVVVICYSGYNQQDSVIMNQSSIDRGLFRSIYYRSYMDLEKRSGVQQLEEFEKSLRENTLRMKHGTYDKLEDDGLVAPGTGRGIGPTHADALEERRLDTTQEHESGIVDQVLITTNSEDAKVRVRSTRIPQIGDKFASRDGQKGTIGITYRQEDMPFTAEGSLWILSPTLTPFLLV
ncbi:DNA-dependent RNA polymerase II [Marasmius tenuissimus]|uniref:DNA-directed RNA polymerase n=1 Tax=Marasmius tenuissimus TaxID=585030 RepID=A0ABR3ADN6_9AGAR